MIQSQSTRLLLLVLFFLLFQSTTKAQVNGVSQPGNLNITKTSTISGVSSVGELHIMSNLMVGISEKDTLTISSFNKQTSDKIGIQGLSKAGVLQIGTVSSSKTVQTPLEKKEKETSGIDVDVEIPHTDRYHKFTYALIIGNEDYHSYQSDLSEEVDVDFARHDARIFKKYCHLTLGIPEKNITLLIDARAIDMHRAINKLSLLAKATRGKGEFLVYYAGHGLPDEKTKEPYLLPVDVSGKDLQFAIQLRDLYDKLTKYPTERVTVFLDACFSGGAREQGLVTYRGVKISPKKQKLKGNLIVFTAASGQQASLPYREKQHGMFTYFLLKKLKKTKGKLTYGELAQFLISEVSINSLLINEKEQTPYVNYNPSIDRNWEMWKF
jgi:hypothetical protein